VDIQQIGTSASSRTEGAGKTTLAEALLFDAKATDRMGKVDDGSSNFDYDRRRSGGRSRSVPPSITTSGQGRGHARRHPGYINFEADTRSCLKVLDGAILVVNAVSGVEVQTEKMWNLARGRTCR